MAHRPAEAPNPAHAGLTSEGLALHISSFPGEGVSGSVVVFYVADVDELFSRFAAAGLSFVLEPHDQTWGTREMYVNDPDGNKPRFIQRGADARD